jgi:tRNA A-37 threonylcarbamoyl transferase component Bud32
MSERDTLIEPDTIIAERYRIVRQVGKGGMGKVYEAKHASIGRRVAIKILNKEFSEDKEALERFQQEAKIAGTIGHINICEVLDFGTTAEGQPFLVMEYLEGESVASMLETRKALPLNVAFAIIKQVLDALEEVHGRGIVHRDLKPENIILTTIRGHGMVVKLLDFGISKVMKAHTESMRLTKTGTMMGTPYYMSPEQIRGNRDIEYTTDLYSSGVILYEMICGKVPYGGANYNDVILSIVEDPFPDPRKLLPGLSSDIARLLRRSMEKDPMKRYESAAEFKEAIAELPIDIGDGKSIELSATKLSRMTDTHTTRQVRQGWLKPAFVIVAALLLIGIIAGLFVMISSMNGTGAAVEGAAHKALAPSAPTPSVETVPPGSGAETVTVTLVGAPEGLTLTCDGKRIDEIVDGAVEIEKSADPMTVILSAKGYLDKSATITPSSDLTLDARLLVAPAKGAMSASKIPTTGAMTEPPPPDETVTPSKKKKKMKPIWDYD